MFIRELIPIPKAERMLNMKKDLVKDLMRIYVYKDSVDDFIKNQERLENEKNSN